jgi:hypothetical protein
VTWECDLQPESRGASGVQARSLTLKRQMVKPYGQRGRAALESLGVVGRVRRQAALTFEMLCFICWLTGGLR